MIWQGSADFNEKENYRLTGERSKEQNPGVFPRCSVLAPVEEFPKCERCSCLRRCWRRVFHWPPRCYPAERVRWRCRKKVARRPHLRLTVRRRNQPRPRQTRIPQPRPPLASPRLRRLLQQPQTRDRWRRQCRRTTVIGTRTGGRGGHSKPARRHHSSQERTNRAACLFPMGAARWIFFNRTER